MTRLPGGLPRRHFIGLAGTLGAAMMIPVSAMADAATIAGGTAPHGLAAWLRRTAQGKVCGSFAVAARGGPWVTVGERMLPSAGGLAMPDPLGSWAARQQACAAARAVIVAMAAGAWRVPVSECRREGGRILHPASGRSIGYRIWTRIT